MTSKRKKKRGRREQQAEQMVEQTPAALPRPGTDEYEVDEAILDWWEFWDQGYSLGAVSDHFGVDVRIVHAALLDLGVLAMPRSMPAKNTGASERPTPTAPFTDLDRQSIKRMVREPTTREQNIMGALAKIVSPEGDYEPRRTVAFALSMEHTVPKRGRVPMSARQREQDKLASAGAEAKYVRDEMIRAGLIDRPGAPVKRVGRYWA